MNDTILELQSKFSSLPSKEKKIALSLMEYHKKHGALTENQEKMAFAIIKHVEQEVSLTPVPSVEPIAQAVKEIPPVKKQFKKEETNGGSFSNILKMFQNAAKHQSQPKIEIGYGSRMYVLSLQGEESKIPGEIYVTDKDTGFWMGKIGKKGEFYPNQKLREESKTKFHDFLMEFNITPTKVVKNHAIKTGRCCFCGRTLIEKSSIRLGYGPTCAHHYGLKH